MPPVLAACLSHLWLAGGTLVLAGLLTRGGDNLLAWWRGVPAHPLSRWGLALLAGLAAWGLFFLGGALTGLFFPSVLAAGAVMMALVTGHGRPGGIRLLAAARAWTAVGRWPVVALLGATGLAATPALIRETQFDSLVYHLGVASQFLNVHRAILGDIHLAFHFSVPVELAFALPVALGDDRFARTMVVLAFIAANAVFAGSMLARGRRDAAWIGPLLVMASPSLLAMVPMAKCDIAASAWFIAGAILTADGCWGLGSAFLGCGVAGKIVYGLPVALWVVAARPPAVRWFRVAAGLGLPGLGWWIKSWLATGTPVFPTTTGILPSPFWGPMNRAAWETVLRPDWKANTLTVTGLPGALLEQLGSDYLLALLLLPAVVVLTRRRRLVGGVLLGMLATIRTAHIARYLLPLAWWTCLEASVTLERWRGRPGRWAGPALAGAVLVLLLIDPLGQRPSWKTLARPPAAQWADFTTMHDAVEHLRGLHPDRVLVVGDLRSYLWPGRILYDGAIGETPLVWRYAHASRSPAELRKKFRQAGARWMLYNYVSDGWIIGRYTAFPWDDAALRRYTAFCRSYLVRSWQSPTSDNANGGFYLFELLARPLPRPPATTWFAPGTESIYWPGAWLQILHRPADAVQAYHEALRRLPDVGLSWNLVGHQYFLMKDVRRAWPYLERFGSQGMMDDVNLSDYAMAMVLTGRIAGADRALEDAWERYPDYRLRMRLQQAGLQGDTCQAAVFDGRTTDAAAALMRAETYLGDIPAGADQDDERMRRQLMAHLTGLRGEIWLAYGDQAKAARYFRDALAIDAAAPLSSRWTSLLHQMESPAP